MADEARYAPSDKVRWGLLAGAVVLAWIAARAAVQSTFAFASPQLAAAMAPADGQTLATMAQRRVSAANGDIDDATRALFRSALVREPLLPEPLILAGLDAAGAGDTDRAERLMVAARERDLRAPLVRFWLFDHFTRSGQYARALDEVGPAVSLQPDATTAIMTVLAAMAETRDGNEALARKLSERPFWETAFFQTAAANAAPEAVLRLLTQLPGARNATEEQRAVFTALIAAGQGDRAYDAWRKLLPAAYRSRASGIYDGNFGKWPGAAPFNWTLEVDPVGTAKMIRAGDLPQSTALDVHYFGSTSGVLARQYVFVPAGSYRLQLAARSRNTSASGGRLVMELRCANNDVAASLPLDGLTGALRSYAAPVQVPAGCSPLRAQLVGNPGELFSEVEAQVTGVALVRAAS